MARRNSAVSIDNLGTILDPLPALRLCGNTLQTLGFSSALLSLPRELDQAVDGRPVEYTNLNHIYDTLQQLSGGLTIRLTPERSTDESISYGDLELQSLVHCCLGICEELIIAANQLRSHSSSSSIFGSFHEALRGVWDEKQVEALEEGLLVCRREAMRVLTIVLRDGQSSILQEVQRLKNQNRKIEMSQTRWLADILETLRDVQHQAAEEYIGDVLPGVTNPFNPNQLSSMACRMAHIVQKASKVAFVQRFLRTLHFRSIRDHHAGIARAHEKSFMWVFPRNIDVEIHHFPRPTILPWLQGENGSIYWVSGKPASGKSTFMKYLLAHPQTLESLRSWAGSEKLVIASHFFWSAGNSMQKSKIGLLQSLLYGEHSEMIELLNSLVHSNIKMCLSSRQWKVFEDAYGASADQKLYLEWHNRDDIHDYVQSELEQHPAWELLLELNPQTHEIVGEIADRAQGVFLWAVLAVRSFGEWLTTGDTLFFLQKKFRMIPVDLELLFKSMLESVDPIYTSYVSHIFNVASSAPEPLPVLLYVSLEREIQDESKVPPQKDVPPTYRGLLLQVEQLRRQLKSMCKGLLEVHCRRNEEDLLRYRVDFLHRTAREFFRGNEIVQAMHVTGRG
ncbi:hypothetical protein BDV32DRAFT_159176 [Aspergillus pseudonomiae]|nr:hypothetical protein BDV32DRAFT_159176 [Aspergillus pseudonomiae]